jgi:hypothetical protein
MDRIEDEKIKGHKQTHRQQGDITSLLLFFCNKKRRLRILQTPSSKISHPIKIKKNPHKNIFAYHYPHPTQIQDTDTKQDPRK